MILRRTDEGAPKCALWALRAEMETTGWNEWVHGARGRTQRRRRVVERGLAGERGVEVGDGDEGERSNTVSMPSCRVETRTCDILAHPLIPLHRKTNARLRVCRRPANPSRCARTCNNSPSSAVPPPRGPAGPILSFVSKPDASTRARRCTRARDVRASVDAAQKSRGMGGQSSPPAAIVRAVGLGGTRVS